MKKELHAALTRLRNFERAIVTDRGTPADVDDYIVSGRESLDRLEVYQAFMLEHPADEFLPARDPDWLASIGFDFGGVLDPHNAEIHGAGNRVSFVGRSPVAKVDRGDGAFFVMGRMVQSIETRGDLLRLLWALRIISPPFEDL